MSFEVYLGNVYIYDHMKKKHGPYPLNKSRQNTFEKAMHSDNPFLLIDFDQPISDNWLVDRLIHFDTRKLKNMEDVKLAIERLRASIAICSARINK